MLKYMKTIKYGQRPRVLLLGNGINLSFDGVKWEELINDIAKKNGRNCDNVKSLPYPLQVVVASNDHVDTAISDLSQNLADVSISIEQSKMILSLVGQDFDAILTTNYTYEIEKSIDSDFKIKSGVTSKYRKKTCANKPRTETLHLYEYIDVAYGESVLPVWHIHGEAAKPSSMIIGHYYYGNVLGLVRQYVGEAISRWKYFEKHKGEFYPRSWVDYFLFGDVYIVGQGLDFSEMDLWWLINCKKRHDQGEIHYYEPSISDDKKLLLETYNVQIHEFTDISNLDYTKYYRDLVLK